MRVTTPWLKLALPAALLAGVLFSSARDKSSPDLRVEPAPALDPHDTVTAPNGSAERPPKLPQPENGSTSFAVKFKEEVSPYPVMAMFVMPGESVPLEAVLTDTLARYSAEVGSGRLERVGARRWLWTAPRRKGVSAIVVRDSASGETITFNAFVMVPRPAGTSIDGFRVGRYEPRALRGDPAYARPRGLVEVTEENRGTFVAPHFTLDQFVSKQPGGYPK